MRWLVIAETAGPRIRLDPGTKAIFPGWRAGRRPGKTFHFGRVGQLP
jgi:hypothetical protein